VWPYTGRCKSKNSVGAKGRRCIKPKNLGVPSIPKKETVVMTPLVEERNNDIEMGIKMLLVDGGVSLMKICGITYGPLGNPNEI
jgi:hypothetical protein